MLDSGWPPEPPRSVNLPNSITLIRIFSIPLLMWILSSGRFSSANWREGTARIAGVYRRLHDRWN